MWICGRVEETEWALCVGLGEGEPRSRELDIPEALATRTASHIGLVGLAGKAPRLVMVAGRHGLAVASQIAVFEPPAVRMPPRSS